jgi:hypothetical protein
MAFLDNVVINQVIAEVFSCVKCECSAACSQNSLPDVVVCILNLVCVFSRCFCYTCFIFILLLRRMHKKIILFSDFQTFVCEFLSLCAPCFGHLILLNLMYPLSFIYEEHKVRSCSFAIFSILVLRIFARCN